MTALGLPPFPDLELGSGFDDLPREGPLDVPASALGEWAGLPVVLIDEIENAGIDRRLVDLRRRLRAGERIDQPLGAETWMP